MNFVGVEADKERNVVVRTMEDGQKICVFYVREQRVDGDCSLMDVNGI